MTKPYFEVGEEVIVCSKNRPQYNGDAVVTRVFSDRSEVEAWLRSVNGGLATYSEDHQAYLLDRKAYDELGREVPCRQSSLRKKHKPGESFDSLIKTLKQPQNVN